VAEGKLIFREASAQALEDAFAKRAAGLREGISGMGAEVRSEIAAWDSGTESRQAQEQRAGQVEKRAELLVQALERAAAGRIPAAIPYFGYARQDRRPRSARVPISAKLVRILRLITGR